jgi:predicted transcriptional regulator
MSEAKLYTKEQLEKEQLEIELLKHTNKEFHRSIERIDKHLDKLESKFNWTMGLIVSGIIIPIILHKYNLI